MPPRQSQLAKWRAESERPATVRREWPRPVRCSANFSTNGANAPAFMRGRRDGEFGSCFRMMVLLWRHEKPQRRTQSYAENENTQATATLLTGQGISPQVRPNSA